MRTNKVMSEEKKNNDKSLIKPEDIKTPAKKVEKKVSLKNDIVEREGEIKTDDGRQLLK
ncbi:MAG: hypothetical protein AABY15_05900 [Nanoarchaeota archaeon]